MEISPANLNFEQKYKLLTGSIVPRPIALVSTISAAGLQNVAPFSYFSIANHNPMALSVCITGAKPDGTAKDTLRNILATRQFVVGVATESNAAAMVKASAPIDIVPVGTSHLVRGTVVAAFVEDGLLDENFRMNFDQLAAVGRLAGTSYTRTTERLHYEDQGFFPGRKRKESHG